MNRSRTLIFLLIGLLLVVSLFFWWQQRGRHERLTLSASQPEATWYEVYFSQVYAGDPAAAAAQPESLDRVLVKKLALARQRIDAALYELDSDTISSALIAAHRRGAAVRLVTETDYMEEDSIQELLRAGIPVTNDSGRGGLMHNKFIVVDNRYVWTGSFNTTDNGAYKNNNNAIWIDSPKLAENFRFEFQEMFDGHSFGKRSDKRLPNPVVQMPDGTRLHTYFAPENDVVSGILDAVESAQQSIYFMAFSFTHDGIGEAMRRRFAAGVDVRGVFETRGSDTEYSEFGAMKAAGIPVMQDRNRYVLHHKVIVIDGRTVITGSFNFSNNAANTNDENLLIIEGNPPIARAYTEEFERVSGISLEGRPVSAVARIPSTLPSSKGINVNRASKRMLEGLPGIGSALAERIIDGRPYRSLEDLASVRGIGPAKLKALEDRVAFRTVR